MRTPPVLLVALGIMWFVIFDILLATTLAAVNTIPNISLYLNSMDSLFYPDVVLTVYIGLRLLLGIPLILFILRLWSKTIDITRRMTKLVLMAVNQDGSDYEMTRILEYLFGEDPISSSSAIWQLFTNFYRSWFLLLALRLFLS